MNSAGLVKAGKVKKFWDAYRACVEAFTLAEWNQLAKQNAASPYQQVAALWLQRVGRQQLFLGCAIASTGFVSMLLNLLLIVALQIYHGHVYPYIGLLTALFMLGLAAGAGLVCFAIEGGLMRG